MKTPLRILTVNLASNSELEGPTHKKIRWEDECIGFIGKDLMDNVQPHEDALVVTLRIGGFDVKRVMIDQESGAEIMYPDLYEGLGLTPEDLTKYNSPLVAFNRSIILPAGQVTLPVGVEGRKEMVHFIVVHSYSPYTAILGCPWIHSISAVPSSLHQKVKFTTEQGIAEIRRNQSVARRC
ncbi:uncharacterized protein LOC115966623 [Quercus lobata]|uniref:uncharacterized protein LOC115966623 n=1 Tax=Quercus lobata TaxID=97700 RepID=UPI001247B45F|nr:uncharacterized protein LOC115966623 [Quercus lobata]